METKKMGLLPEYKHLFNKSCSNIWALTGIENNLWLQEVNSAQECGNNIRDRDMARENINNYTGFMGNLPHS